ncbi:hypothetical protein AB0N17_06470 [Streptomyces sp. NPDC051133]|uniref:hypothetical protein n=1 Tax=Streptomyces sp. NPDC051133 TaxID=3155521 RepID=UPI00342EC903
MSTQESPQNPQAPQPSQPPQASQTTAQPSYEPRYEPPPSVGKLFFWVLLFLVAALAVVLGGVYFT